MWMWSLPFLLAPWWIATHRHGDFPAAGAASGAGGSRASGYSPSSGLSRPGQPGGIEVFVPRTPGGG